MIIVVITIACGKWMFVLKKILYDYLHVIGLVSRLFANGLGGLGSILGHIIPKNLKTVLDTS